MVNKRLAKLDLKIGAIFNYNEQVLKVIESDDCSICFACENDHICALLPKCSPISCKDEKSKAFILN